MYFFSFSVVVKLIFRMVMPLLYPLSYHSGTFVSSFLFTFTEVGLDDLYFFAVLLVPSRLR